MEELSKKLDSKNEVIQIQALSKLLSITQKQLPPIRLADGQNNVLPDVQFLWEKCINDSPVVSDGVCKILVTLAAQNRLSFTYVINGFVSQVLSSRDRPTSCLIRAIKDLIVLHSFSNVEHTTSPIFNLRSCVHPFMIILQHRPELWSEVLDQIKNILCSHLKSNPRNVYQAISPVLKAILWNPLRISSLAMLRLKLLIHLREANLDIDTDSLLLFMDESLQWLQVESISTVLESSTVLEEVAKLFLMHPSLCENWRFDNVILSLTLTCMEGCKYSVDLSSLLQCLKMLTKQTESLPMTNSSQASLVAMSSLLGICLPLHQQTIIEICLMLTSRSGVDPLVSSCLILPLVTILNVSSHWSPLPGILSTSSRPAAQNLLSRIEDALVSEVHSSEVPDASASKIHDTIVDLATIGETSFCAYQIVQLAYYFRSNQSSVRIWLHRVRDILGTIANSVPNQLLGFVAAIASHGLRDLQIARDATDVLILIAEKDFEKAPNLVSLLLYKLQRERDPSIRLHILKSLPRVAVHKVCTPSILGTIQAFGQLPELHPLCLRLMGLLWQNQERAFPHLQKLLLCDSNNVKSAALYSVDDALLSRAACVRDICQLKPHLYGAEFLSWLSQLIINNRGKNGTAVTVLSLESISLLCRSGVIDLQTTWKFIFQKLQRDTRPLVVQKMCQLLSLAESLKSPNKEYEKFLFESVSLLWRYAQTWNDTIVNRAAFNGLSNFDSSRHTLKHFCEDVKRKVKLPSHLAATPFDMAKKPEDVMSYVPGSCYIDLMLLVHKETLHDYGTLMCSLVKQEVRDMPQTLIYCTNVRSSMAVNKSDDGCIDRISTILTDRYETRNLPGLQGSLALGLLLAFDHPLVLGSDNIPTKPSVVKQGKMFENMLDVLLVQSCLEVSDWRKSIIFSTAWTTFMERLYFSMVQARLIQIDAQQNRPSTTETSDTQPVNHESLKDSAWLFVRDKICSTLQNASRGKASVHGNSLLALCGLAAAVLKYCNSNVVERNEGQTEYMPHRHWTAEIVNAITGVLQLRSDARSSRFAWCQPGPGASCSIAQAYASLSVEILTPILINMGLGSVNELLLIYFEQLRNSANIPMLQFCLGVGLGQFGCQLVNEHFFNVGGEEGSQILLRIANRLKKWCFSGEELDTKCGGILGLSLYSSALCSKTNDEFQEFVVAVHQDFVQHLESEPVSTLPYHILSVGRALVSISGTRSGILQKESVEAYSEDLKWKCSQYPNNSGTSTAYGLILHYLEANGSPKYMTLKNSQMTTWMETLKQENAPTLAKLAAANGAFSAMPLCFENVSQLVKANAKQSRIDGTVIKFVNTLSVMLDSSRDINLLNCCTWILGVSRWSAKRANETADGAALDYSYLPASSILRPVVAYLQDFIEKGSNRELEPYVVVCLECLAQESHKPYPNLSWSSLLSPLFCTSEDIQEQCVDVVLTRLSSSATAVPLISSWMLGLSDRLHRSSKIKLYRGISKFMNFVTPKTLEAFLRKTLDSIFNNTNDSSSSLLQQFVEGIVLSLQAPNPAIGVTQILNLVAAEIFHHIDPNDMQTWDSFCVAATHLSDDVVDQLIEPRPSDYKHIVKIAMLCCNLVGVGRQPITLLNNCLDAVLVCNLNTENYEKIIRSLMSCFWSTGSRNGTIDIRLNWLLQLMGHIKSILHWQSTLTISSTNHMKEVIGRFFDVFACSVVGWSCSQFLFFYWESSHEIQSVLTILPSSLQYLLNQDVWNKHNKKVIEWLIQLYEHPITPLPVKMCCKGCLFAARQTPEFKKSAIWTRVMDLEGISAI